MADKSCKTCEYDYYNNCHGQNCEDCAMVNHDGGCICNDWYDGGKNCPHYKKYEPTKAKGSEHNENEKQKGGN